MATKVPGLKVDGSGPFNRFYRGHAEGPMPYAAPVNDAAFVRSFRARDRASMPKYDQATTR